MEESRKQFEAWITEWWPQVKGNICRDGDSYSNHFMNYAWEGWQASRSAIEIEIPAKNDCKSDFYGELERGENIGIDNCAAAISAAGLRVKEK